MTRRPVEIPGWDSHAEIVDERYIERIPRRPEVRRGLERECRNLPILASLLPLAVPVPQIVPADSHGPWRVRHETVPGTPADPDVLSRADGERVGSFLRVLHDLPHDSCGLDLAVDEALPVAIQQMEREVVPLLDRALRGAAEALLERVRRPSPLTVAHGDLGPAHLLVSGEGVVGVIDWTDSAMRDPAIDLAWVLHGTPDAFVRGVVDRYRPTVDESRRALDWHLMGPWHEVLWGMGAGGEAAVQSGLAGVEKRLRQARG